MNLFRLKKELKRINNSLQYLLFKAVGGGKSVLQNLVLKNGIIYVPIGEKVLLLPIDTVFDV